MAITGLCGFEMGDLTEGGSIGAGTASVQSTVKRSGSYALRSNPTASPSGYMAFASVAAGASSRSNFLSCSFAIRVDTMPSSTAWVVIMGTTNDSLALLSDGTLRIASTSATSPPADAVTSSNALTADAAWHWITFDVGWSGGSGRRVFVDGVEWASSSSVAASAKTKMYLGLQAAFNITANVYFDDLRIEDSSTGGATSEGTMLLLLPTADPVALNSWTNGGGGTTSIFEGVNNIPPTGAAASTNGIKIKNAASGGNLDYVATMQTYTAAGVPSGATVNAVMALCNDGEEINTGTKAGGIWIASNPAQGAGGNSFDYGDDGGALGTFPTGWCTHCGPVTSAPSVTLGTAPTVTVRKTSSTTRVVDVDFLGLYVDYTPAAAFTPVDPFGMMGMFGI